MYYRFKDKTASPFGSFKEGEVLEITTEKYPGLPIDNWVETGLLIPLEPLKGGDPASTSDSSATDGNEDEGTSTTTVEPTPAEPDTNELKLPPKKKGSK
jgi:hypothetical protein